MSRSKKKISKPRPAVSKSYKILVEDCGGYFQIYKQTDESDVKLGNIYPPGYEQFGEIFDRFRYVSEDGRIHGDYFHKTFKEAFIRLVFGDDE